MAGLNLFTNNAATTLASAINSSVTSLSVASGTGALFPTLTGSQYFYCTLANNAGTVEIVKVTARSTDTFTIVRAQDGTSSVSWSSGDKVELRLTRIDLLNFPQLDSSNDFSSTGVFSIGTNQFYKDASGNVGIGTASPGVKFQIQQDQAAYSYFDYVNATASGGIVWRQIHRNLANTTTSSVDLAWLTSGGFIINNNDTGSANFTAFGVGGTERMRISSTGGLSVGTTADAGAGGIYATANITSYYSSDARLKENIKDIPNALNIVNHIGGKLFDWTDDYIKDHGGEDGYFVNKSDFGVIAQDVKEVFPIAVRERQDKTLAVDYEKLCALAFAAIKELTEKVNKLEAK